MRTRRSSKKAPASTAASGNKKTRYTTIRMPVTFKGEYGGCPCCDEATPIRLCGLDNDVRNRPWQASEELVRRIYGDLTTPGATNEKRHARCGFCANWIEDRCFYWFGFEGDPPEGLKGLACSKCVLKRTLAMEEESGRILPVVAYEIVYGILTEKRVASVGIEPLVPKELSADTGKYLIF